MNDWRTRLASYDYWYHTIELPGGVRTPGLFDMPGAVAKSGLPESLEGLRCLDIGTADGFWAFEMEKRGAAEVVTLDLSRTEALDWPPAKGAVPHGELMHPVRFWLAHEALGSSVIYREGSIYDLAAEEHGRFDFVFIGSMLLHLRDPVRALDAVRGVTAGRLLLNEAISPWATVTAPRVPMAALIGLSDPTWWVPNPEGLRRMLMTAGFDVTDTGRPYMLRLGEGRRTAGDRSYVPPIRARPLKGLPMSLARHARDRMGRLHTWALAAPRADLAA